MIYGYNTHLSGVLLHNQGHIYSLYRQSTEVLYKYAICAELQCMVVLYTSCIRIYSPAHREHYLAHDLLPYRTPYSIELSPNSL